MEQNKFQVGDIVKIQHTKDPEKFTLGRIIAVRSDKNGMAYRLDYLTGTSHTVEWFYSFDFFSVEKLESYNLSCNTLR
jgi:hypothetical protein